MFACLWFPIATWFAAPSPTIVVDAHVIPGAVVFDLDRDQLTIAIDDDGRVTSTTRDRHSLHRATQPIGATLPSHIDRIDLAADGGHVIVVGDDRVVEVALSPS
jgi:hypothetical protein